MPSISLVQQSTCLWEWELYCRHEMTGQEMSVRMYVRMYAIHAGVMYADSEVGSMSVYSAYGCVYVCA